jgi:hypothetical protein
LTLRTAFIGLAAFALLMLATTSALMAPGAIFTTDNACSGVDLNIYASKDAVYLNGGPSGGGPGLPDGFYYVQVTEPDGTVLGTSVGSGTPTPVHVTSGNFDQCYQLSAIVIKASDSSPGYDDTSNPGGEYKVWVSSGPTFDNSESKTDNFKVREDVPPIGTLEVEKFYDADTSGTFTAGDTPIVGWEVRVGGQADFSTLFETKMTPVSIVDLAPGCYTAQEGDVTNWIHTNTSIQSAEVIAGGTTTIEFGNVCLGPGGGMTLGFWSNKNGQGLITGSQLCNLNGLNLKSGNGLDFNAVAGCAAPSNAQINAGKTALKSWLLNGNATNMAYMLSVQLTAMQLNVLNGKVLGTAIVYAPGTGITGNDFVSISQLIAAANADLGTPGHENTTSGTPGDIYRATQEALKNALDKANNNLNFVQTAGQCGVDAQTNVLSGVSFTYPATFTVPACP